MVSDHVEEARDVADIAGALSDECQLPWRPQQRHLVEGGQERLVVRPELEMVALQLQHDPEMPD